MRKLLFYRLVVLVALSAALIQSASAGGPLKSLSGVPILWNTDAPVSYFIDQGDLGPFSHDEAVQLVQDAFNAWQNVEYSSLTFENKGLLSEDVTGNNFFSFIPNPPAGVNPVIFDDDGSIIQSLFGVGAEKDFLGVADPKATFGNFEFVSAYFIINGAYLETENDDPGAALSTILHELGHFIGLDHSQLLRHVAYDGVGFNDGIVPIMFPTAADDDSFRTFLTGDDKAALASLYPNKLFDRETGGISGVVKRGNQELPGINVIAHKIDDASPFEEHFSTVTGYFEPGFGTFELKGLPEGEYNVYIEPIDPFFTGASRVGPNAFTLSSQSFQNPPPAAFYYFPGTPPSRSTATTVTVRKGNISSGFCDICDLLIRAGFETVSTDEHNRNTLILTQILAVNGEDIGGVPPLGFLEFQYLLEPSGNEGGITVTIIADQPNSRFELLAAEERRVTQTERAVAFSRLGIAKMTFGEDGDFPLEKKRFFIAVRNRSREDLTFTIQVEEEVADAVEPPSITSTHTPTNTFTRTPTLTRTPTQIPTVAPTETPSESPVTQPTIVPPMETPTATFRPTFTPTRTSTPTRIPRSTPTPTAREVNPFLGLVSMDEIGGVFPRGAAAHNFDEGLSDDGNLVLPGLFDGLPDLSALAQILILDGIIFPLARDMEFSGEISPNGNGSEGVYYLNGGMISNLPPVSAKLGATGGINRGGIDTNNNPFDNINYETFRGDPIPNLAELENAAEPELFYPLVDLEAAGNRGFFVLTNRGKIYAEGSALESIDLNTPPPNFRRGALAADMVIYRGTEIMLTNSLYSSNLSGAGAYILDQQGFIYSIGDVPALDLSQLPVLAQNSGFIFHDIELIPDPEGRKWIGLGALSGDGLIHFIPFETTTVDEELEDFLNGLSPFGLLNQGFGIDIARGFEVEISDNSIYGLNNKGETVPTSGRRIGIIMFDGFGGIHTGGRSTRFIPLFGVESQDIRVIDGFRASVFPITIPYFGIDVTVDLEISPQLDISIRQ